MKKEELDPEVIDEKLEEIDVWNEEYEEVVKSYI